MEKNDSYFKMKQSKPLKVLFMMIFASVIIGLLYIFRYYFWPFLISAILYLALKPFNDRLLKYVKKRSLSSLIVIIFLVILILVPLFFLLISVADQAYQLYSFIENKIDSKFIESLQNNPIVAKFVSRLNINEAEIIKKLTDYVQNAVGIIFSSMTAIVSYPITFSVNFFFMLLMLFFLFKDGYKIGPIFYRIMPFPDDIEKSVVDRLKEVIRVLLTGNLLIMLFQGLMLGLGFYIAGLGMPLLWGSISAILSLIPVIGTTLVWGPVVIYLLITGSFLKALFVGVWSLFWYLFLENLIKPKIFGKKLHFHPVLFFFLLLGSIQAFNLPGVILGPLLLTLFFSLWEIYKILSDYENNQNQD